MRFNHSRRRVHNPAFVWMNVGLFTMHGDFNRHAPMHSFRLRTA